MSASSEAGGRGLLQFSQVGLSSSMRTLQTDALIPGKRHIHPGDHDEERHRRHDFAVKTGALLPGPNVVVDLPESAPVPQPGPLQRGHGQQSTEDYHQRACFHEGTACRRLKDRGGLTAKLPAAQTPSSYSACVRSTRTRQRPHNLIRNTWPKESNVAKATSMVRCVGAVSASS